MDPLVKATLEATPGCSPWDWKTFPAVNGERETRFVWHQDNQDGRGGSYVVLRVDGSPAYKLVLGTGSHPFAVGPGRLGLWFADSDSIRIVCFDVDGLPDIPRPTRFTRLQMHYHAAAEPLASLLIPSDLSAGCHKIAVPDCFVDEVLAVAPYGSNGSTTIFALKPAAGELTIYPQKWFDDKYRGGWEWIRKVARHPERGSIIGGGERIRAFELTEDGCHLARWL